MTSIFKDEFGGSGRMNGHNPSIGFGGQSWVSVSPNELAEIEKMDLSGGYAIESPAPINEYSGKGVAEYGVLGIDYGNPQAFTVTFTIRMYTDLHWTYEDYGYILRLSVGGITINFRVQGKYNGDGWFITFGDETFLPPGDSWAEPIEADTEYTGVITVDDGFQELKIFGETFTKNEAFSNSDGLSLIHVEVGTNQRLASLTIGDPVIPVLPVFAIQADMGASLEFGFPVPKSEYVFASDIDFRFPMMRLDAGFVKNAEIEFDFPVMKLNSRLLDMSGKNELNFAFPVMKFEGQMGGSVGFRLPMMTLEADMTSTALIQVDFAFPALSLDASLTGEGYKVALDFALPMMGFEAKFGGGVAFNLPMMTIDAHLQAGGLMNLDFTIPMMKLDAQATQQNHGAIEFTFPMMVPMYGITADFAIPMMQLDAHIKAVVSVTYEAYSVNLTHTAEAPTDEVTRYTNYPFDQIVRLGANYYGVATDGLYLLGGKLDNAQPIAYTVKTCIDDFKVKEFKNIASGYFGGRIGPDMKVTVFAGEQGDESYDYSTPRGQGAQNHREKFGRGVKNRYYAIGVSGQEELVLDNIELEINKMTRRI